MLNCAQQQAHYGGIGGSLAAAVLGVDHYKTPLQAWFELTDPISREDLSGHEPVIFGNVLEEPIAQEAARRLDVRIRRVNRTLHHPEFPFIIAHPDRLIVGRREGLEIKNRSHWKDKDYGEDGTDEADLAEIAQCQHYLAVTGYERWHLAVLIGGQRLRLFKVERDEELIALMIEKEAAFWRHVETRTPPPPTTAADVAALYPRDSGAAIVADEAALTAVEALQAVKAQLKELTAHEEALEFQIKAAMGEVATLLGPAGKPLATWKHQVSKVLNQKAFANHHPDLFARYKSHRTTRVFRIKDL